jgi:hypothetical protein
MKLNFGTTIGLFPYTFLMLMSFLLGCSNKMYVSKFSKYNTIDSSFLKTFENGSLKFSIYFWGRNSYQLLGTKRKIAIPVYCYSILKSMGIKKDAKVILYLKPQDDKYAEASYGFVVDKKLSDIDTSRFAWNKTRQGEDYFVSKKWYEYGNTNNTIGGFNIADRSFVLIESQTPFVSAEQAKTGELSNTKSQLETLLKNENRAAFSRKKDSIAGKINNSFYAKTYLLPIVALQAIPTDTIWKYTLEHSYFQPLINRISFLDDLDIIKAAYINYKFLMNGRSKVSVAKPLVTVANGDALEKVQEIAKKQKMIMINENHYDYRHRLFVTLLLDSLYSIGYRNLCIEDRKSATTLNNSAPQKEDGYYIQEPFMAGLIRKAIEIGFNVYGYDSDANSIQERERGQANNLFNLYSKDPTGKWVVLAGYAHINKKYWMEGVASAHQEFTKLAGFAPYSINQSSFSDITYESQKINKAEIGYYVVDTANAVYNEGQSDLYVINNVGSHPYEYPFASIKPSLHKYVLKLADTVAVNSVFFLYLKKELDKLGSSAIPVYISKIKKDRNFVLYLPKQEYSYILTDSVENELAKGELASLVNE